MTTHKKLVRLTRFSNLAAVSKAAGLGRATLGRILRGESDISISTAISLAKVLDVDIGWLLDPSKKWPPARSVAREELVGSSAA